jgi:hypothetical protein
MNSWDNTWIKIHSVPGFELITVDVMRGDEIWVRKQIDGNRDWPKYGEDELLDVLLAYWDAICDSNGNTE